MVEWHQVAQARSVMRHRKAGEGDFVMTGSRRTDASHWLGTIGLLLSFFFILALTIR
jgi:hypothetical protein